MAQCSAFASKGIKLRKLWEYIEQAYSASVAVHTDIYDEYKIQSVLAKLVRTLFSSVKSAEIGRFTDWRIVPFVL